MNNAVYGLTEKAVSIWMRINERMAEDERRRENERVWMICTTDRGARA